MTKLLLYLLLFVNLSSYGQTDSIYVDDLYRKYVVHLPLGYDGSTELPVVLGFHGGFGNAEQFEEQSLLSEKADEANFIVVYPDGLGFLIAPNLHFWNAGVCCGYPYINDVDDVNFIRNLIDQLAIDFAVDEDRVYATGISNGAFMSYRLACELSDKIAAIAPVAGGMIVEDCPSDRQVPIIHFHSYLDENIPYNGGYGDGPSSHYNPPLDSVFNVWSTIGNCGIEEDTLYHDLDYTLVSWRNCDCGSEINYYISTDGGHSWPGGTSPPLGDPVSSVLNANDLMWNFFQEHDINCGPSIIETNDKPIFGIYPNPSTNTVSISCNTPIESVQITSIVGKTVVTENNISTTSITLNIAELPAGIYIISILQDSAKKSRQLIVE